MAVAMIGPKFSAWDKNGKPLAFGRLYTYQARTNIPKPTFQSEDQVVENTNPVILNGEGYANVYLSGSYKMVLKDKDENEIWSSDPVSSAEPSEWVLCLTATYLSSTSFEINENFTSQYEAGRRVRIDNNTSEYSYSTIESSVFSGGKTTVTILDPVITTGLVETCVSIVGPESSNIEQRLINDLSQSYSFKTVAAMKSSLLIFPEGKKIFWQGYHEESDGGSNWGIVKIGAHTEDGGSIFSLNDGKYIEANLKGKKLNVRKFGAVGDEFTDDTAAVQAAFDMQFTSVFFPSGKGDTTSLSAAYLITSTITVNAKCRIFSDAPSETANPTQIYTNQPITIFDIKETTCTIDNLSFRGDGAIGGGSTAINFARDAAGAAVTNDVRLHNLWFTDFMICVRGQYGIQGMHFENCTFDVNDVGITVSTVDDVATFARNIIIGCRFYRNRQCIVAGGSFAQAENSLVEHNIISNNVFDLTGFGNTIATGDAAIVFTSGPRFNVIANNQFIDNSRDIYLSFGDENIIQGNKFRNTNRNSLSIIGEENCLVSSNSFYNQNLDNSVLVDEDCVITTYSVVNFRTQFNTYGYIGTNNVNQAIHFQTDPISIETNSDTFYINASDSPDKLFNQITIAKNTALLNGWVNNSNPAKVQKDNGVVYLSMQATAGTTTSGTAVYNLPDGYRPTDISINMPVTSTTSTINIEITTGGDIILNGTAGFWVDLNISFRI